LVKFRGILPRGSSAGAERIAVETIWTIEVEASWYFIKYYKKLDDKL